MNKGELIDDLTDVLNKKYKGEKIAYNLESDEDSPANVPEWISTGSTTLDLAISNRVGGGYPVGRIIEITGWEQSGKSLLAAHAMVSTQQKGGIAVYIDTENSVSKEFWKAIGVDVDKVLYVPVDTIERVFEVMETIISKVRASDKNKLVTIIVDSVAASTTEVEQDSDFSKDGWSTTKAIVMSKSMRKITGMIGRERVCCIFTNQLREKLGVMFGDNTTTSGGKALQFHASVRLRLRAVKKIEQDGVTIGQNTRARIIKNRVGPPQREATFSIFFDRGVDDYESWMDTLKKHDLVSGGGGGWYKYTMVDADTGEVLEEEPYKFRSTEFVEFLEENPTVRQNMYENIANALIMKYRSQEVDYGNTELVDIEEEEDGDDDG